MSIIWISSNAKILISMIVSFSGIDSSGKSSQVELLQKYCEERQLKIKKEWSKARGTPGVVLLKELMRKDKGSSYQEKVQHRKEVFNDPTRQLILYIASMLDLCWYWGIFFRISSLFNKILICDRYLWDTYVDLKFDFFSIDVDNSFLWKMVRFCAPTPKVSFVFVISAELSLTRDKQKDADGIEDVELKKSKISVYINLITQGKWTHVMDGTKSIEKLHGEVKQALGL